MDRTQGARPRRRGRGRGRRPHSDTRGRVVLDSGCRGRVAGKQWHDEARRRLADLGLRLVELPCDDRFRFWFWRWPCDPCLKKLEVSTRRGRNGVLNDAEALQECQPLLSAKCMGELGAVMDSKEKSLTIAGEARPMQMLSSGHPALDASEYDDDGNFDQEFVVAADARWKARCRVAS